MGMEVLGWESMERSTENCQLLGMGAVEKGS